MNRGWIKLNREVSDHWIWSEEPFTKGQAWIDLLLHANHKPSKISIKGQVIPLDTGDQARSELTLTKSWKWSRGKVRRFLSKLETELMISQKTGHLTSVISICNYSLYQDAPAIGGTPADTPDGTTSGHLTVHRQECKNGKNEIINIEFESLWKVFDEKYGKKGSKKKALAQFIRLPQSTKETLQDIVRQQIKIKISERQESIFSPDFPHVERWLRDERWSDEINNNPVAKEYFA